MAIVKGLSYRLHRRYPRGTVMAIECGTCLWRIARSTVGKRDYPVGQCSPRWLYNRMLKAMRTHILFYHSEATKV